MPTKHEIDALYNWNSHAYYLQTCKPSHGNVLNSLSRAYRGNQYSTCLFSYSSAAVRNIIQARENSHVLALTQIPFPCTFSERFRADCTRPQSNGNDTLPQVLTDFCLLSLFKTNAPAGLLSPPLNHFSFVGTFYTTRCPQVKWNICVGTVQISEFESDTTVFSWGYLLTYISKHSRSQSWGLPFLNLLVYINHILVVAAVCSHVFMKPRQHKSENILEASCDSCHKP